MPKSVDAALLLLGLLLLLTHALSSLEEGWVEIALVDKLLQHVKDILIGEGFLTKLGELLLSLEEKLERVDTT